MNVERKLEGFWSINPAEISANLQKFRLFHYLYARRAKEFRISNKFFILNRVTSLA